jgi:hypothetical protein
LEIVDLSYARASVVSTLEENIQDWRDRVMYPFKWCAVVYVGETWVMVVDRGISIHKVEAALVLVREYRLPAVRTFKNI